jgi:hypothetical protein
LQDALGWSNSHLHQLLVGERRIGMKGIDEFSDDVEDEKRIKLSQIAVEKSRLLVYGRHSRTARTLIGVL